MIAGGDMSTPIRALGRRRSVRALAVGAVATAAAVTLLIAARPSEAATTLGSAARAKGNRTFATAVANGHLGDSAYTATLDREFTGLTPENEMKWDATEASRNSFSFGAADAIVSHAQNHGMKVRGHTLVWHNQLPGWVSSITSGSTLLSVMQNHIAKVAGHFKGSITYWDVATSSSSASATRTSRTRSAPRGRPTRARSCATTTTTPRTRTRRATRSTTW
jgi:endo-1,4-beta-xylanase